MTNNTKYTKVLIRFDNENYDYILTLVDKFGFSPSEIINYMFAMLVKSKFEQNLEVAKKFKDMLAVLEQKEQEREERLACNEKPNA